MMKTIKQYINLTMYTSDETISENDHPRQYN